MLSEKENGRDIMEYEVLIGTKHWEDRERGLVRFILAKSSETSYYTAIESQYMGATSLRETTIVHSLGSGIESFYARVLPFIKNEESKGKKKIVIELRGGCLVNVKNLPDDYDYELIDYDDENITVPIRGKKASDFRTKKVDADTLEGVSETLVSGYREDASKETDIPSQEEELLELSTRQKLYLKRSMEIGSDLTWIEFSDLSHKLCKFTEDDFISLVKGEFK